MPFGLRLASLGRQFVPAGLARQLQVLAALLLAGITVLVAHQLYRSRVGALADSEEEMSRLGMVFAERTGHSVETVDLILHSIAEDIRAGRLPGRDGYTGYGSTLARRIAMLRQTSAVALADDAGHLVLASDPLLLHFSLPPEIATTIAGVAEGRISGLEITRPFRGPRGSWTALMVRALPRAAGAGRLAAIGFLDLSYFEDFFRAVELTEKGAVMLHRRDGVVLARYPHDDAMIGRSYADLPPFKQILAKQIAGTLIMDSPIDGDRRVVAIHALKAFPLAISVSVSERAVLSRWRHEALALGISTLVVGGVFIGLLMTLAYRSRENDRLLRSLREAKETAEAAGARMVLEMEERTRVENALRKAQRAEAIGQITGGVAHDFNNLLSIVLGNIDLLERTLQPEEKTMARLATMRSAAERGATLTGQLLAFARRQPLMPRPVDLNGLLSGLRDLVQSAIGSRIKLQVKLNTDAGTAMIDPAQIELVILNLAINARDAMPDGGTLTIETLLTHVPPGAGTDDLACGDYVTLLVRDSGVGMSERVVTRAFEPFFTTKEVGHSGLGLSQVYGIARQLGGGARIESGLGQGTAVYVYLPRAGTTAASDLPALIRRAGVVHQGAVVLVVDDDHAVRATLASLLAALGYRVVEVSNGAEALDELESGGPVDVLLTDVVMPGMTGPELARRAVIVQPNLPVVFISGYSDPDALSGTGGIVHLVRKPARPEELVEQLEAAMNGANMAA
jgi:signal transduction histidine kinase/ActR/RegA family two-component response regulator